MALVGAMAGVGACGGSSESESTPPERVTVTVTVEAPSASRSTEHEVRLAVPAGISEGRVLPAARQLGTVEAVVEVVSRDDGAVRTAVGRTGGLAFDFPGFVADEADPPRAVLSVVSEEADRDDPLAPGGADFTFGAEVLVDRESSGTKVDNGDNILQRGLASDISQYKVELNNGRPTCRVQGDQGAVEVTAAIEVDHEHWFAISCARVGDSVEIYVVQYFDDGGTVDVAAVERGSIGEVAWPDKHPPLTVGGKLSADGQVIRTATDQFNGLVADPTVMIAD